MRSKSDRVRLVGRVGQGARTLAIGIGDATPETLTGIGTLASGALTHRFAATRAERHRWVGQVRRVGTQIALAIARGVETLSVRDKDLNELYDLKDDPWETRNLYADRQCASVISRLAGDIHRWQQTTNDKLRI